MNTRNIIYAITATLLCCACAKENEPQPKPEEKPDAAKFTAFSEALTKTVVSDDCLSICWSKGDALSLLADGANLCFTTDKDGVSSSLSSESDIKKNTKSIWGIYPYSEDYILSSDGSELTVALSHEQKIDRAGLPEGANVSVAYLPVASETNELDFCNIASYLLLDIPDSERIIECTIYAEPSANLAGKVRIKMDEDAMPIVEEILEGQESVTLASEYPFDGKCLIPLIPQSVAATYHVDVKKVDGTLEKDYLISDGEVILRRNQKIALTKPTPEPVTNPELSVLHAFWSDAVLSIILPSGAESAKVILNGSEVGEASSNSYRLTGLNCGSEYSVKLSALVKGKTLESNEVTFNTGKIEQLVKNVSPTSVAVSIENRAGALSGNYKPCLYVQLFESEDVSGTPKYEAFVRDNEVMSEGHPFYKSLVAGSGTTYTPFNLAFGGLEAGKDYWFRVKSVALDTYKTYRAASISGESRTMESQNGDSEYSKPFRLTTAQKHTAAESEVLFEGFDDCIFSADFINCAVGLMPAFRTQTQLSGTNYNLNKNIWTAWENEGKAWSFHGLRIGFPNTHMAALGFLNAQKGDTDITFEGGNAAAVKYWVTESKSSTTLLAPSVLKGARIGSFRAQNTTGFESMVEDNRFITMDSYMGEGYAVLGMYYDSSEKQTSSKKPAAFVVKAVSNLAAAEKKSCTVTFKALAVQGRSGKITVIHFNKDGNHRKAASDLWDTVTEIKIANSNGNIDENATDWSGLSETHKWYEYSFDIDLLQGDLVGFATDSESCICIDDIKIVLK